MGAEVSVISQKAHRVCRESCEVRAIIYCLSKVSSWASWEKKIKSCTLTRTCVSSCWGVQRNWNLWSCDDRKGYYPWKTACENPTAPRGRWGVSTSSSLLSVGMALKTENRWSNMTLLSSSSWTVSREWITDVREQNCYNSSTLTWNAGQNTHRTPGNNIMSRTCQTVHMVWPGLSKQLEEMKCCTECW